MIYGCRPCTTLDLNPFPLPPRPSEAVLDFSNYLKDVYEEVKQRLSLNTQSYEAFINTRCKTKQFDIGDIVLIRLGP